MKIQITDTDGVTHEVTVTMPGTVSDVRELCIAWYKHRNSPAGLRVACAVLALCGGVNTQARYTDSYDPMVYGATVYDGLAERFSPAELTQAAYQVVTELLYPRLEPSIKAISKARTF